MLEVCAETEAGIRVGHPIISVKFKPKFFIHRNSSIYFKGPQYPLSSSIRTDRRLTTEMQETN